MQAEMGGVKRRLSRRGSAICPTGPARLGREGSKKIRPPDKRRESTTMLPPLVVSGDIHCAYILQNMKCVLDCHSRINLDQSNRLFDTYITSYTADKNCRTGGGTSAKVPEDVEDGSIPTPPASPRALEGKDKEEAVGKTKRSSSEERNHQQKQRHEEGVGSSKKIASKPKPCEHNHRRSQCKQCGGASFCELNRRRSTPCPPPKAPPSPYQHLPAVVWSCPD